MLLVVLLSASCYLLVKAGLAFAPSLRFAGLRALLAGLALLIFLVIRQKQFWPRAWLAWWIVPLGLTATTFTYGTMFLSPTYLGAGIATVLGNLQPLWIIILASVFLGEPITSRKILILVSALVGLGLIALNPKGGGGGHTLHGSLLALGTSAGGATASIIVKKLKPGVDLLALIGWQLVVGSLPLLAWSWATEPTSIHWTPEFLGLLLIVALVGTSLTSVVWFQLLQETEAGPLSLWLFLVPVLGLLFGYLVYGETLGGTTIWGILFILLALGTTVVTHFANPWNKVDV